MNTTTSSFMTSPSSSSSFAAISKEVASIRSYQIGKRMHSVRKASFKLFHSKRVITVVAAVEKAVDVGHIKVRSDRPMWQDIGEWKLFLVSFQSMQRHTNSSITSLLKDFKIGGSV